MTIMGGGHWKPGRVCASSCQRQSCTSRSGFVYTIPENKSSAAPHVRGRTTTKRKKKKNNIVTSPSPPNTALEIVAPGSKKPAAPSRHEKERERESDPPLNPPVPCCTCILCTFYFTLPQPCPPAPAPPTGPESGSACRPRERVCARGRARAPAPRPERTLSGSRAWPPRRPAARARFGGANLYASTKGS
jgi:hypothetical protein